MTYWNAAVPILGVLSLYPQEELLPHAIEESEPAGVCVSLSELGALDATDFIPLGSCRQRGSEGFYWAAQRIVSRDMLDAYDQTERGAAVADCASDALARGAA